MLADAETTMLGWRTKTTTEPTDRLIFNLTPGPTMASANQLPTPTTTGHDQVTAVGRTLPIVSARLVALYM
jgi:hypothetical protein